MYNNSRQTTASANTRYVQNIIKITEGMVKFVCFFISFSRLSCILVHTHTHPFNGPLSGSTRVSRYQKGKTNLDFTGARDSEWPVKTEWWGAGMVICLERGADLHVVQLMPLPLTVSCFSKIHIGYTFLVPAHLGDPGQRAVKRVCVCVDHNHSSLEIQRAAQTV